MTDHEYGRFEIHGHTLIVTGGGPDLPVNVRSHRYNGSWLVVTITGAATESPMPHWALQWFPDEVGKRPRARVERTAVDLFCAYWARHLKVCDG